MAPHICAALKLPFQYFSLKHPSITDSTRHKCVCIPITSNFLAIFPPNIVQHTWLCHFHTLYHCLHLCPLYNAQNPILYSLFNSLLAFTFLIQSMIALFIVSFRFQCPLRVITVCVVRCHISCVQSHRCPFYCEGALSIG